ncbi:hypothetical protein pb186bvf_008715 [Paramecium bursaria]
MGINYDYLNIFSCPMFKINKNNNNYQSNIILAKLVEKAKVQQTIYQLTQTIYFIESFLSRWVKKYTIYRCESINKIQLEDVIILHFQDQFIVNSCDKNFETLLNTNSQ